VTSAGRYTSELCVCKLFSRHESSFSILIMEKDPMPWSSRQPILYIIAVGTVLRLMAKWRSSDKFYKDRHKSLVDEDATTVRLDRPAES